jgi:hypothetical protein
MYGREAPVALDYESHGEGGVAVGRGGFVGHDELEAGVDGVGCERGFWWVLSAIFAAYVWISGGGIPRAGFTSIRTRRSACFSVMSSPARSRWGRIWLYFQTWGTEVGFGRGGLSLLIWAHSGFVCWVSRSARRASDVSLLALEFIVTSVEVRVADGAILILCDNHRENRAELEK